MNARAASVLLRAFVMLGALLGQGIASAALPSPERVTFDSRDVDAAGVPVRIEGILYKPPGPPPVHGFPGVIALHGCSGMYSTQSGRERELSPHNAMWTQTLLADGYAVLFPDSFGSRGQREVCTIMFGARTILPATRRLDTLGALAWLGTRPEIDRERVALLGFSHGGSTTLATINARDRAVAAFRDAPGAPPFFRAAVAYYPGCRAYLNAGPRWEPAIPTRVYIGEKDDWTPAAPCAALGTAQHARGAPLEVTVYPDSYHVFDGPGRRLIVRKDVPNGVYGDAGVTLGPNPAAAAEALASMRAFLRERLAGAQPVANQGLTMPGAPPGEQEQTHGTGSR